MIPAEVRGVAAPPWQWPWWRTVAGEQMTLVWMLLIHLVAVIGLVALPLARLASRVGDICAGVDRRDWHDRLLPPGVGASGAALTSPAAADPHFLCDVQWIRGSSLLDCKSSPAPCDSGYAPGYFESSHRRLLVGASTLALASRTGSAKPVLS